MNPSSPLAPILAALERAVGELSPQEAPAALGDLERVKALVWAKMMQGNGVAQGRGDGQAEGRYLTVKDVAERTGMSGDYIYRHAREFGGHKEGSRWRFTDEGLARRRRERQRGA